MANGPIIDILPVLTPKIIARLWSRIDKRGPDECWPWRGSVINGYGVMSIGLKGSGKTLNLLAHRVTKTLQLCRAITPVLRHSCHNPPCCNPAHLLEGTHADNHADSVAAGRQNPEHIGTVNAGRYGVRASASKYTEAQRHRAIGLWRAGTTRHEIARLVGCHRETISRWLYDAFPIALRMPASSKRMRKAQ